jgi:NADH:ubiquinone reductase (H+-translocating)
MATVSRFSAVAKVGPLELGGFVAWVVWLLLHLVYLVGFKSKMTAVTSWMATFLRMNRGQLTITGRQALAQAKRINLRFVASVFFGCFPGLTDNGSI